MASGTRAWHGQRRRAPGLELDLTCVQATPELSLVIHQGLKERSEGNASRLERSGVAAVGEAAANARRLSSGRRRNATPPAPFPIPACPKPRGTLFAGHKGAWQHQQRCTGGNRWARRPTGAGFSAGSAGSVTLAVEPLCGLLTAQCDAPTCTYASQMQIEGRGVDLEAKGGCCIGWCDADRRRA